MDMRLSSRNSDWLISRIALEDAILGAIKARKYSEENDYETAAKARERMNDLLAWGAESDVEA